MATDSYTNESNDNVDRLIRLARSLLCIPADVKEYLHAKPESSEADPTGTIFNNKAGSTPDPTGEKFNKAAGMDATGETYDEYKRIAEEEIQKITAKKFKKTPPTKPPKNTQLFLDIISESKRKAQNIVNFIKSQENCNYNSAELAKCFSEAIDDIIANSTAEKLYELSKTVSTIIDNNLIDIRGILDSPALHANNEIAIISSLLYLDETLYYKLNTLNRGPGQGEISR
jgi:hypothetical protein